MRCYYYIYCVCMWGGGGMWYACALMFMEECECGSPDNLLEAVLSFYHVGSRNCTRLVWFISRHL